MGFNWKAFGAAFLDKQTEGIKKRRTDAEEFEDKEEELAKANRKAIADRTLLASEYGQMAEKAIALGASKEQVMAAMGSGAMGIKTFYEKLLAAANQKGMQTLGSSDVEAIIDMPEVFEVNPAYIDMKVVLSHSHVFFQVLCLERIEFDFLQENLASVAQTTRMCDGALPARSRGAEE